MPAFEIENLSTLSAHCGQELAVTDWITITQERINQFAEITEDEQWIHTDPQRAASESPFGTTIAHGFLTLSLLSRFLKEAIHIRSGLSLAINYGLNRVRFPAPVPVRSRLRARVTLLASESITNGVECVWGITVECEGAPKPCCVAEWVVRYLR
jgi:acyl dehydratase